MRTSLSSYFFSFFYFLIGIVLIVVLPPMVIWGDAISDFFYLGSTVVNSIFINIAFFTFSFITFLRIEKYPQKKASIYILPITLSVFITLMAGISAFRIDYSIKIIAFAFLCNVILLSFQYYFFLKKRKLNFLVVPFGDTSNLISGPFFSFSKLSKPQLQDGRIDGIVVDFRSANLPSQWEIFIARCAIKGLQVLNANQLNESITGKVNVEHLKENNFGNLAPSPLLIFLKRIIDVFIVLLLLPIVLPIILITILFICFESEGGAFYRQVRIGFQGKTFMILKFRSMYVEKASKIDRPKDIETHRITKVGHFIRKYRIDELPQFWNVLKGDLSLIGPRPETLVWTKKYCREVPFYFYRHIVRPGVTGWAQVMQGHVHGIDSTKLKLEYDFYYIKHFSLWLDLLIVYRTFKTVFSGHGSR